jgi:hypothetical protein
LLLALISELPPAQRKKKSCSLVILPAHDAFISKKGMVTTSDDNPGDAGGE